MSKNLKIVIHSNSTSTDLLTPLGVFLVVWWIVITSVWISQKNTAQLLWLCDPGILLVGVGLLMKSRLILTAQLTGFLIFHVFWSIDLFTYLLTNRFVIRATEYMFSSSLTSIERGLSAFHIFLMPIALYGCYKLGIHKKGWLFQSCQTATLVTLTYLIASPNQNINRILVLFPDLQKLISPQIEYALVVFLSPVLVYWPTNIFLTRIIKYKHHPSRPDSINA